MTVLELTLFGGFVVRRDSGEVIELAGRKDRALLGFLAVSPGTTYSRDRLAGLLWGDHGDRQARDSLKQSLLRLRRALAPVVPPPLVAGRQSVGFDGTAVAVDVVRFEQWARAGTAEMIERAVALYQGDLLEGLTVRSAAFEDWLLVERQRLRQLAIEALSSLLAQSSATGRRDRATMAARQLLSLDPLNELACRTLMQSHTERMERTQAMKLFESLRGRLQQELGVQPEAETVALYQSIRRQHAGPSERLTEPLGGPKDQRDSSVVSIDAIHDTGQAAPPTIAVLPFTNIGGDPEQEYFADGLTEDIITDLSRVSALFVVARHTVFTFKGKPVHVQDVAQELNVRYLLEGSVRKAGSRVRITTQLVDGTTGGHVWAHRYDRSVDDVIALQDEISKSIVDILKVKLLPGELETITHRATANPTAYEYHLVGRSFYLRGLDRRSLTIARALFTKAIELDPNYARAYAGAAICDSYLTMSDLSASFESTLAKIARALELEPDLAEAYAVKGLVLFAAGRYDDAAVEFEHALKLGPELFEAHYFYARNCRQQGRHCEAATLFAHAAELRPNDFRSMGLLAEQYKTLGRRDDFMSAARRCLERLAAELAVRADDADAWAFGSAILAQLGQETRAEDWATRALVIGPDGYMVRYNVARTYTLLGKIDSALANLEGAFDALPEFQRRLAAWMKYDEEIAPLRSHPRFHALEERLEAAASDATGPAAGSHRPTIAVLPFRNINGDQEEEHFADGLTESIIADLSQVSALSVVARHTVSTFKGKHIPAQKIASALRVGYALEGNVRRAGGRICITTLLIDGATGEQLWTRRYDRPLDDIFSLQDEITKSIVNVLRVKLLPGELEAITSRPTTNAQAYEYYLMGRSFYLRGIDKHSLRIAREMFAKASEIDPRYARAYACIAVCDFYLAMSDSNGSFESALANAARALELEPNLAEAYAAKGLALYAVGSYVAASAEFERALTCDPNSFEAHFFYGRNCRLQGLHRQAATLFERAADLRPNDFRSLGLLAVAYKSLGRPADSLTALRRCMQRVEAEVESHPDNADALAFGSALLAELGQRACAEDWAARALMIGLDDYLVQYNVARAYALLGKTDEALPRLQRAFCTSPTCRRRLGEWMKQDEKIDPLRGDLRFLALVRSLEAAAETAIPPVPATDS
jgi:TolB-like protein/DNA-binding SARP family transcriptional activator/predicted Zn-dependent protease